MKLTIGVPSYQGAQRLPLLLNSINEAAKQLSNQNMKQAVLIVLDGSTDNSAQILRELSTTLTRIDLQWLRQENAGRSNARNRLVSLCKTELLWFLDDDTIVNTDSLSSHLNANRSKCPIIMGPCRSDDEHLNNWFYTRYDRLEESSFIRQDNFFFSTANTSAGISIWKSHLFDETFVGHGFEDYDLGLRLIESDICICYSSAAEVKHYSTQADIDKPSRWIESGVNLVRFCKKHNEFWNWSFTDSSIYATKTNRLFATMFQANRLSLLFIATQSLWKIANLTRIKKVKMLAQNSALIYGISVAGGNKKLKEYLND